MRYAGKKADEKPIGAGTGALLGGGVGGLLGVALGYIYGHRGKWLMYDALGAGSLGALAGAVAYEGSAKDTSGGGTGDDDGNIPGFTPEESAAYKEWFNTHDEKTGAPLTLGSGYKAWLEEKRRGPLEMLADTFKLNFRTISNNKKSEDFWKKRTAEGKGNMSPELERDLKDADKSYIAEGVSWLPKYKILDTLGTGLAMAYRSAFGTNK